MNRAHHAFRIVALAFVAEALALANTASAGNPATFTINSGTGDLTFGGGAMCTNHFDSGGPTGFQTSTGSAKPGVRTTFIGTGFVASCHGTTSGGGGGSNVIITITFAGTNSFTVDTTQAFQLGNTYNVTVRETGGPMRTCTSNASPAGNFQLTHPTPIVGFPRLWPSDSVGAANPSFSVGSPGLTKGAFANVSPTFPSCGGWGPTLTGNFSGGITAFDFDYTIQY